MMPTENQDGNLDGVGLTTGSSSYPLELSSTWLHFNDRIWQIPSIGVGIAGAVLNEALQGMRGRPVFSEAAGLARRPRTPELEVVRRLS